MLSFLEHLEEITGFGPFRLFGYTSVRAVLAVLIAWVTMMVVMPRLIRWLQKKKFGEQGGKAEGAAVVDDMREAKAGTPTMGGLGLIGCLLFAAVLCCDPLSPFTWILITTVVGYGALGLADDRTKIFAGANGMGKGTKMLCQLGLGIALGLWLVAIDSPQIIQQIEPLQLSPGNYEWQVTERVTSEDIGHRLTLPFAPIEWALPVGAVGLVIWTLMMSFACSNSVNFTDGLDGLAAGVSLIAVLAFMVIAYLASHFVAAHHLGIFHVPGSQEVAVFCAAAVGALCGFLWFNAHPAQVFMGDTGSQALGGMLAMISLCCKQEFLILLVGFIFFAEGASVFLQVAYFKLTGGKRLFLCAPIHHHFQYKQWPETRVVLRFWVVAAVMALLALATLKLR